MFAQPLAPLNRLWLGLALAAGLGVALLPPTLSLFILLGLVLAPAFYHEPMLALLFVVCLAPLKTLIETELGWPLPLDIGQLALGLFILVWGLRHMTLPQTPRLYWPWLLLLAVTFFIISAGLSLFSAYSIGATLNELLKWGQIALLILLVANAPRWEWALFGLILSAALQAIIGLWQFMGGSGAAHLWIMDYRFFRAFGTFGQPNPFGAFMAMTLPLALGTSAGYLMMAYTQNSERRSHSALGFLYGGMAGLILAGLLASWSRGAWLGFLGAAAVMGLTFPRQGWRGGLILGGGGLSVTLLAMMGWLPRSLTDRLIGFGGDFVGFADVRGVVISDANFAVVERLAHWQAALAMAAEHPLLGVGFGNYEAVYSRYALINWPLALGHAHNYYLNLLAETGIIGLLAYLAMWAVIFGLTLYILRGLPSRAWHLRGMAAGLLGTWTHISIHSLLDKLYVNNLFIHVGLMLGLLAVLGRLCAASQPASAVRGSLFDNAHESY